MEFNRYGQSSIRINSVGVKKLDEMFAKMGFHHKEYKDKYEY